MKNIKEIIKINRLMVLAIFSLIVLSCKDFLEIVPQDRVSEATVWSDPSVADQFLNDIYRGFPQYHLAYRNSETWTDNFMNNQSWQGPAEIVRSGTMSPSSYPGYDPDWYSSSDWTWEGNFSQIRKCNLFIQKVRQSYALSSNYKSERIAEAKFLRAWYYTKIFQYFGSAPILTQPLDVSTQGDSIFHKRATVQETASFISSDCLAAADTLPVLQAEWGRITKGAALALKGRIDLLAASPLNNPGNDKSLWARAAASNKQVIDLGKYRIMDYYHGLFLEENNGNSEMILPLTNRFPRATFNPDERELENDYGPAYVKIEPYGFVNYSIVTAIPTQDMVDAYRMKDGKTIKESSLYDPNNPYANREPRFYQSIIYDGTPFRDGIIYTRKGDPHNAVDRTRTQWITPTGYYAYKIYDERINGLLDRPNGRKNLSDWPLIRYAEVLLSYAEAQNEAIGPDASVLDAINKIRTRKDVSIPTIEATYGTVSQDQMREIIRNERRIELAFEDKRWVDIMRWKLGDKLKGFIIGVEPSLDPVTGNMNYEYFNVAPQYFDTNNDKNYRLPIPLWIMEKNPNLIQNPGY